jgi:hypothetical protein
MPLNPSRRPDENIAAGKRYAVSEREAEFLRREPDFENPTAAKSISSGDPQNLKFERADWSLFRTVEGLSQRAGVLPDKLTGLVLKEIADNGLDAGARVAVGKLPDESGYYVEDNGPGIDGAPEAIARLFSISRPMISTKLFRLPTRGALGNGLRVVAGAVLASAGSLRVITRNRRIELRPEADGTTTVIKVKKVNHPIGTRIEIAFGPALRDRYTLEMARTACHMARRGQAFSGKSSPWWYDVPNFHELFLAAPANLPVRELVSQLDGCTGSKAGEIVAAAGLNRAICSRVTRAQAEKLLLAARANARQVNPKRLGAIGPELYDDTAYGYAQGVAGFGATRPQAEIPFNVEAWAARAKETHCTACVNRTVISGTLNAGREKRDIDLFGCGLAHTVAKAPATANFTIIFNIATPYMPITSDGKAPNLLPFLREIETAITKAVRKASRPDAGNKLSQKDVVLDNLKAAIAAASGDGEYRFNERQIFYQLRKIVLDDTGQELKIGNFKGILTDYENENGEISRMYREPRGSIYHPHRGDDIPLGTLTVEEYERPAWTFNKLVYVEKEGFSEALKDNGWPERHDCALMSSKGFTTRAARDLVDKLAEHDERVTIFCVHDADAFGTMIYQTFQEATRARGARKIKIINLGLEPWEAIEDGLGIEDGPPENQRKAVASYVLEREDGDYWEEWLQTHRVELNAMTTPEFIAWLDRKMAEHGAVKLIPPDDVVVAELEARITTKVRASITERILREAGLEGQVAEALDAINRPSGAILVEGIKSMFESKPDREWRDHVEAVATERSKERQL